MHQQHATGASAPGLLNIVASLVIDYLRWTQLAPMVTMWLFALLMLVAMFFVNNQEASFKALESVSLWIEGLPWLGDALAAQKASMADEQGHISLDGDDFKAFALKAWGVISLVFWVLALIANWLFGPFKPWPLMRKLGVAALACLGLLLGFVAVYLADSEQFNGGAGSWVLMFSAVATLVLIVSAWCLSIAHALGLLNRLISKR